MSAAPSLRFAEIVRRMVGDGSPKALGKLFKPRKRKPSDGGPAGLVAIGQAGEAVARIRDEGIEKPGRRFTPFGHSTDECDHEGFEGDVAGEQVRDDVVIAGRHDGSPVSTIELYEGYLAFVASQLPPHDVDRVATAGPDGGPSESGPAFSREAAE